MDPLNNGKVVYMPLETLHKDVGQQGYNLVFLQIDPQENPQVIAQIETEATKENLSVAELDTVVYKHVEFSE